MEQQTVTTQAQEAKRFGDTFEQFGEQMAAWGEEFGPRMEVWAEELAQKMELTGERVRQWFEEQAASRAASAGSLREERLAILRMVEEGKISVTEAESLLRALGE
ncbi:MAG: hypothetical protein ACE5I2_07780 [Anaerolineae bacterium]